MNGWLEQVFSKLRFSVSLRSLLSLALAAIVVLVTTACSPNSPSVTGSGSYYDKKGQNTELYDPIQPRKGGMNQYEDTDPRRNIQ